MNYIAICVKKYRIIEIVVRLALYDRKMNFNQLANHVLTKIHNRLGLSSNDCLTVYLDRASTNRAALKKSNEQFPHIRSQKYFCTSHGLSNVEEKVIDAAKYAESFRRH